MRFRSLVPVDGQDVSAWVLYLPGVERVSSVSTPERWVDGADLTIVSEYRVTKERPRLEVGLFPSTVRFGDGSVEQLANSVQVTISWVGAGSGGRVQSPARSVGYQLYFDGKLVSGPDAAGYTRAQAESNCRWNRETKPKIEIRCVYEGETFWPIPKAGASSTPVSGPRAVAPASPIAGRWRDDSGPIFLEVSGSALTGTYTFRDGRLAGTVEAGGRVAGIWSQSSSATRCGTERLGTFYWGRFEAQFSGDTFEGKIGWCDGTIGAPWTGHRAP